MPTSRKPRDEGAPEAPETIPPAGPGLADVQDETVRAATVGTTLPTDPSQETGDPLAPGIGASGAPASAPSTAPAGSSWTDDADQTLPQRNEYDAGPTIGYVVAWAKAAVHVRLGAVQTRGEGDEEERYVTVQAAGGETREAVLEGEQVTLHRGEVLPAETAPGQGAFLAGIGAVVAVSVPAEDQPTNRPPAADSDDDSD